MPNEVSLSYLDTLKKEILNFNNAKQVTYLENLLKQDLHLKYFIPIKYLLAEAHYQLSNDANAKPASHGEKAIGYYEDCIMFWPDDDTKKSIILKTTKLLIANNQLSDAIYFINDYVKGISCTDHELLYMQGKAYLKLARAKYDLDNDNRFHCIIALKHSMNLNLQNPRGYAILAEAYLLPLHGPSCHTAYDYTPVQDLANKCIQFASSARHASMGYGLRGFVGLSLKEHNALEDLEQAFKLLPANNKVLYFLIRDKQWGAINTLIEKDLFHDIDLNYCYETNTLDNITANSLLWHLSCAEQYDLLKRLISVHDRSICLHIPFAQPVSEWVMYYEKGQLAKIIDQLTNQPGLNIQMQHGSEEYRKRLSTIVIHNARLADFYTEANEDFTAFKENPTIDDVNTLYLALNKLQRAKELGHPQTHKLNLEIHSAFAKLAPEMSLKKLMEFKQKYLNSKTLNPDYDSLKIYDVYCDTLLALQCSTSNPNLTGNTSTFHHRRKEKLQVSPPSEYLKSKL